MSRAVQLRSVEAVRALVGHELGVSGWHTVEQQDIDAFADLTGDREWLHVDVPRAANGPFGGTIAHGLLTLSLIPGFATEIYRVELDRATLNYGFDRVRFPSPVPVDTRLRARCRVGGVEDHRAGTLIRLEYAVEADAAGGVAVVCAAEQLLLALR